MNDPSSRNPGLDGLRGIAVLLVVGLHSAQLRPDGIFSFLAVTGPFSGGFLGVDLFFVLSGFLITDLLLREQQRRQRNDLCRFWRARAFRILPALIAVLAAYATYSIASGYPAQGTPTTMMATVVGALTFTYNWFPVFNIDKIAPSMGQLWSLSVEEQFYLFWPLLVGTVLSIRRRTAPVVSFLVVAIVGVGVWRSVVFHRAGWLQAYTRTDTRIDGLLIGALLAIVAARGFRVRRGATVIGWVGVATVAAVVAFAPSSDRAFFYQGGFTLVAVATAAVVLALSQRQPSLERVFGVAPLRAVGTVSYGLYLWHVPVFYAIERWGQHWAGAARVAVAFGATAVCVVGSWYLLEVPMQRLRWRADAAAARGDESTAGVRHVIGRVGWIGVAAGGVAVIVAAVRGVLGMARRSGAALPDIASLRANAFEQLTNRPSRTYLLADSLQVDGHGHYTLAGSWTAVLRMPLRALDPGLHPGFVTVSLALAWAACVALALALVVRVRRLRPGLRIADGRVVNAFVATVALGVAAWYHLQSEAQSTERLAWILPAALLLVFAALGFAERSSGQRTLLAATAVVIAASVHPVVGWAAVAIAVSCAIVAFVRRRVVSGAALLVAIACTAMVVVANPLGRQAVEPAAVRTGWTPPTAAAKDTVFAPLDCASLYGSHDPVPAAAGVTRWQSADLPELGLIMHFWLPATKAGTWRLATLPAADNAVVALESQADGSVRYVVRTSASVSHGSSWVVVPDEVQVVNVDVDPTHRSYTVSAEGQTIARLPFTSDQPPTPEVLLENPYSATGAVVTVARRGLTAASLCTDSVAAAFATMRTGDARPSPATKGAVFVEGPCRAIYSSDGADVATWSLAEARPVYLDVMYRSVPTRAARRELARARESDRLSVSVESDDSGRVRYRVDAPYVSSAGEWHTVTAGIVEHVHIDASGRAKAFAVTVGNNEIGTMPESVQIPHGPMVHVLFERTPDDSTAADTKGAIDVAVDELPQSSSSLCLTAARAWPTPARSDKAIDEFNLSSVHANDTVVFGACDAVVAATGLAASPLRPLEFSALHATVVTPATLIGEQPVVDIAQQPAMQVTVEGDGKGNIRFHAKVPYLTSNGPWVKADRAGGHAVSVVADGALATFVVTADGVVVGSLPTSTHDPAGVTSLHVGAIATPDPSSGVVVTRTSSPSDSPFCHALPAPAG